MKTTTGTCCKHLRPKRRLSLHTRNSFDRSTEPLNPSASLCSIILPSVRGVISIRAARILHNVCFYLFSTHFSPPYQLFTASSLTSTMKAFASAVAAILVGLSAATPIANSAADAESHLEKRTNAGVYICNNANFGAPCVHLSNPTGDCSTFRHSESLSCTQKKSIR